MKFFKQRFQNESGSLLLSTMIFVMIFAFLWASMLNMMSADMAMGGNEMQANQALQIGNGGIQYALLELKNGHNPTTTKNLAGGVFEVSTIPPLQTVIVKSEMGKAQKEQVINTNFAADCLDVSLENAHIINNEVTDIMLKKTCHEQVILTGLKLTWNDGASTQINQIDFNYSSVTILGPNANANSGEYLDTVDQAIVNGGGFPDIDFYFNDNIMAPAQFTLTLYYADESYEHISFAHEGGTTLVTEISSQQGDGFEVDETSQDIHVTPKKNVEFLVLGSAITCGQGGPPIEVRTDLSINSTWQTLFNDDPVDGGEIFSDLTSLSEVTYVVRSRASLPVCVNFSSSYDTNNLIQSMVLLDGSYVPALDGANGQTSVYNFLEGYIDSHGQVKLSPNQAIVLFENGIDIVSDGMENADFQDLVVLITVTDS